MSFLRCCFWPILRSGFINTALQVWTRTWPWKIGWHEWNQQPTNADSEGYIQKQGISRASWSYIIQIYSNAMFPTNIKEQININQCKKIATKQNPKRALKKNTVPGVFHPDSSLAALLAMLAPPMHAAHTSLTPRSFTPGIRRLRFFFWMIPVGLSGYPGGCHQMWLENPWKSSIFWGFEWENHFAIWPYLMTPEGILMTFDDPMSRWANVA